MKAMSELALNRLLYQAIEALNTLNEALGNEEDPLNHRQRYDLEMAYKRIQYKTEKAA